MKALQPCPDSLSQEQIEQFREEGYLAFSEVLSNPEVADACESLSRLAASVVTSDQVERHGQFWSPKGKTLQVMFESGFSPEDNTVDSDYELKIRKLMHFTDHDQFLDDVYQNHSRIHGVLASLLGDNPIPFQNMALIKPPFIGSEKPWHQDNAYFAVKPLEAVLGVWIALDDATVENGCMHVVPGGNRGGALRHHQDRDCEIMPDRVADAKVLPIEVPAGGALFFAGMLPHKTPPNRSSERRRAIQYHYRAADSEIIEAEEYDTIFTEADGTPASCQAAR